MGSQRSWQGLDLRCYRRSRCLLIFVLLALPLSATTYYVDNCVAAGNDSNSGTSTSTPWLTLGKVNGFALNPGDTVQLRGGCTWREMLRLTHNGTSGHPITVQSYGTGQAIINGSVLLNSGWTNTSGNVWQLALTTEPAWVFFNGTLGTHVGSTGAITAPGYWYWAANVLYVYSTSDPATAFTNPGIEAPIREGVVQGIYTYLIFNNLNVQKTTHGFELYQSSHMTVSNSTITYNSGRAIMFNGGGADDLAVFGNTISYTGDDAIGTGGGTGGAIYNNDVSHCGLLIDDRSCLSLFGATAGVSVYSNKFHDSTEQTGPVGIRGIILDTQTGGGPNYIHHNLVYNCNGHGIEGFEAASGQQIYYNVVVNNPNGGNSYINGITFSNGSDTLIYGNTLYNNAFACIYLSNDTSDVVKNNICLLTGSQIGIWDDTSTSGQVMDYNLVYGGSGSKYNILGTGYTTAAALYAATGFGQHDINSDPKLNSPTTGDFTLQSSSPAIDAGTNLGSTYQLGLAPASFWPSAVSTLNQNVEGAGWEIGAFVFVQQIRPAPPTALSVTVN